MLLPVFAKKSMFCTRGPGSTPFYCRYLFFDARVWFRTTVSSQTQDELYVELLEGFSSIFLPPSSHCIEQSYKYCMCCSSCCRAVAFTLVLPHRDWDIFIQVLCTSQATSIFLLKSALSWKWNARLQGDRGCLFGRRRPPTPLLLLLFSPVHAHYHDLLAESTFIPVFSVGSHWLLLEESLFIRAVKQTLWSGGAIRCVTSASRSSEHTRKQKSVW